MMDLIKKIYHLKLAPVSEDTNKAAKILCRELPFKTYEFASGLEHNGWVVPKKWTVKKAYIYKNDKLIYDGRNHPLGVVGYSTSFKGKVTLDELKKHLFYHPTLPQALVYHCDYYYKQWKKDWGFSVPYNLFKKLPRGNYDIDLETVFENDSMKVLDFFLKGSSDETVILSSHNCHAGQADDAISGVVVGVEIMKELMKRKNRRLSYRLIIAPEHLGVVFYLANLPKKILKTLKYAIFLELLGNKNRFVFQESFSGESLIDRATHHYLKHNFPNYSSGGFRKLIGNDEIVWEAPGYEVPCISIARWPYPEYHSNFDNIKIISEKKLIEAKNMVLGIANILETNCKLKRKFQGLVALSHPKYDLYIPPTTDPSIRVKKSAESVKWNYLMNCLTRYFDGKTTILDIAIKYDVDYFKLYEYLKKFEEKKLISFG